MGIISSIYQRGNESAAHYTKGVRSPTIRGVPKDTLKPSKITRINVFVHQYDVDMPVTIDALASFAMSCGYHYGE